MPQSVFNRYEKKYLMPERVYQELRGRLSRVCPKFCVTTAKW